MYKQIKFNIGDRVSVDDFKEIFDVEITTKEKVVLQKFCEVNARIVGMQCMTGNEMMYFVTAQLNEVEDVHNEGNQDIIEKYSGMSRTVLIPEDKLTFVSRMDNADDEDDDDTDEDDDDYAAAPGKPIEAGYRVRVTGDTAFIFEHMLMHHKTLFDEYGMYNVYPIYKNGEDWDIRVEYALSEHPDIYSFHANKNLITDITAVIPDVRFFTVPENTLTAYVRGSKDSRYPFDKNSDQARIAKVLKEDREELATELEEWEAWLDTDGSRRPSSTENISDEEDETEERPEPVNFWFVVAFGIFIAAVLAMIWGEWS